jgi:hypothetical protein
MRGATANSTSKASNMPAKIQPEPAGCIGDRHGDGAAQGERSCGGARETDVLRVERLLKPGR